MGCEGVLPFCMLQASDMGTPELRRLLRLLLRQHNGGAAVAPAALGPAAEALVSELRSTAEAAVSAAEAGGGQRPAELAVAAAAAASVDGFSPEVGASAASRCTAAACPGVGCPESAM
jgi:hypothetical protein